MTAFLLKNSPLQVLWQ